MTAQTLLNVVDLDEETGRAMEEVPPWPRPPWLIEQMERLRYPQLWEAVRTTWQREPHSSLQYLLADHVNHILMNQYRQELWPGSNPFEQHAPLANRPDGQRPGQNRRERRQRTGRRGRYRPVRVRDRSPPRWWRRLRPRHRHARNSNGSRAGLRPEAEKDGCCSVHMTDRGLSA